MEQAKCSNYTLAFDSKMKIHVKSELSTICVYVAKPFHAFVLEDNVHSNGQQ